MQRNTAVLPWALKHIWCELTSELWCWYRSTYIPSVHTLLVWRLFTSTHILADIGETLLQSFLLHQRAFNTVHDDIHHLNKKKKTTFDRFWTIVRYKSLNHFLGCGICWDNKYKRLKCNFCILQPADRQHLRASFLSGCQSPAGSLSWLGTEWWCGHFVGTGSWPELRCNDGPKKPKKMHKSPHYWHWLRVSYLADKWGPSEAACRLIGFTSFAMVVMKAGGRAVAIRERAWRAERAASAGGLRGRPMVTLKKEKKWGLR